jgi:hypothetical protein
VQGVVQVQGVGFYKPATCTIIIIKFNRQVMSMSPLPHNIVVFSNMFANQPLFSESHDQANNHIQDIVAHQAKRWYTICVEHASTPTTHSYQHASHGNDKKLIRIEGSNSLRIPLAPSKHKFMFVDDRSGEGKDRKPYPNPSESHIVKI